MFLRGQRRYRVESMNPPPHSVTSTVLWETIRDALYYAQFQYYANPNVTRLQGREMLTKQRPCTKWQKYSQNTTIFISYEWVDHIAVGSTQRGCLTSKRPCGHFRGLDIHPCGRRVRYPLDRI
jgi:hypothetical protein